MNIDSKTKVIQEINKLDGYQGYVQFSHRPIDKDRDIFLLSSPKVEDESGFVYEAHFYNPKENISISIKQINDGWVLNKDEDIPLSDKQTYLSDIKDFDYNISMAQIWQEEEDKFCEGMRVKKLKKQLFAGFEKGDKS